MLPDARGLPAGGAINWTNGFLPARHQGVVLRTQRRRRSTTCSRPGQSPPSDRDGQPRPARAAEPPATWSARGGDDALAARIRSYELAAQMQLAVPEVDRPVDARPAATQAALRPRPPETADFGRGCLLARRLLERACASCSSSPAASFGSPRINWDGHENVEAEPRPGGRPDRPAGRRPAPRPAAARPARRHAGPLHHRVRPHAVRRSRPPTWSAPGRDHNQYGFTVWLAGAGLKHGFAYGATDEIGWKAAENPVTWHDFHATVLHLLGIDHERLTFYHNGIRRRLTNVHGEVVQGSWPDRSRLCPAMRGPNHAR